LNALGRHAAFEVALGCNGMVWLHCGNPNDAVLMRNALLSCRHLDEYHAVALVDRLAAESKANSKNK
jgi:exosome complex RNA-binding protein Rrp4